MSVADMFTITANLLAQNELNRQQADRDAQRAETEAQYRGRRTTSNDHRCTTCGHGEYTHQQYNPHPCGDADCACRGFTTTNLRG